MAIANYVKFLRGTPRLYENLVHKDEDTLYFIYEKDASKGVLYLGSKLISGTNEDGAAVEVSLNDIKDIIITTEELKDRNLLVYDEAQAKWVNKSPDDMVFIGATSTSDGKAGLVPAPRSFFEENEDFYLNANGEWTNLIEKYPQLFRGSNHIIATLGATINAATIEDFLSTAQDIKQKIIDYYTIEDPLFKPIQPKDNDLIIIYDTVTNQENPFESGICSSNYWIYIFSDGTTNQEDLIRTNPNYDYLRNNDALPLVNDGEFYPIITSWVPNNIAADIHGIKEELLDIHNDLITKADSVDVYTKGETDTKIAEGVAGAAHLKRKEVSSIDDINVTAADADQYIYMVPSGLESDDNKFYEYIIIESTGAEGEPVKRIERVGSWEVDLTDYAKKSDIIIKEVNPTEFSVDENGILSISGIEQAKIIGLDESLSNKVDKVEGYGLISLTDIEKLSNIDEGAEENFIKSVDESSFTVDSTGKLILKNSEIETLKTQIGDFTKLIHTSENSTLIDEVNALQQQMVWQDLAET